LLPESFQGAGVTGEIVGKESKRDEAAQTDILCFVNQSHPASPDLFEDAAVRNRRSYYSI
jgi:hypothetical protein